MTYPFLTVHSLVNELPDNREIFVQNIKNTTTKTHHLINKADVHNHQIPTTIWALGEVPKINRVKIRAEIVQGIWDVANTIQQ